MNKKYILIILILIICVTGIILIQLAIREEQDERSQAHEQTKEDTASIDINKTVKEKDLVEGFPDVPLPPQAVLEKTSTNQTEKGQFYEGEWRTEGQVPEIMKWYVKKLEDTGWRVKIPSADLDQIAEQSATYTKDNMELTVAADQETDTELEVLIVVEVFKRQ